MDFGLSIIDFVTISNKVPTPASGNIAFCLVDYR
jgi:hypothetical protein